VKFRWPFQKLLMHPNFPTSSCDSLEPWFGPLGDSYVPRWEPLP